MHLKNIQAIKNLIKKAHTQEALDLLVKSIDSSWSDERRDQLTHVQARWSRLQLEKVKGLYTREELNVQYNHLHEDILALVDGKALPSTKNAPIAAIQNNTTIWIFGILGLLVLGISLAVVPYFLTPSTFSQQFIFYATEAKSKRITSGEVSFFYEEIIDLRKINAQGILIPSLPRNLKGKEITLHPNIAGYNTKAITIEIPKKNVPVEVIIPPAVYRTEVKGNLSLPDGSPAKGYLIEFGGQEGYSDNRGDFSVTLAVPTGTEVFYRVYKDEKLIKEDYQIVQTRLINLGLPY